MAQTLREALKSKSVSLTHSESLELVAKILAEYAACYNETRIHRSLEKDSSSRRASERLGVISREAFITNIADSEFLADTRADL